MADDIEINRKREKGRRKGGRFLLGSLILFALCIAGYSLLSRGEANDAVPRLNKLGAELERAENKAMGGGGESQDYRRRVDDQNRREGQRAVVRNESTFPVLLAGTPPIPDPEPDPEPEPKPEPEVEPEPDFETFVLEQEQTPQVVPVKDSPAPPTVNEYRVQAMLNAMGEIKDGMPLGRAFVGQVDNKQKQNENMPSVATRTAQRRTTQVSSFSKKEKKASALRLVPGDVLYAVNEYEANSDSARNDVVVRVLSPAKYNGARLFGQFEDANETLIVEFSRMVWNGQSYSLRALAVDPTQSDFDVSDEVDTHFLERWGAFAAATILEGIGKGIERSASTTIRDGGSVVVTRKRSSDRDLVIEGVTNIGTRAISHLKENINRPATVKKHAGSEVGVLILDIRN